MSRIKIVKLKNGATLLHKYQKINHGVFFNFLYYGAGALNEPEGKDGIAHFAEHCLAGGTKKMSPKELKTYITDRAQRNMETSLNNISVWAYCSKRDVADIAKVFIDMIVENALTKEFFENERKVIITEMNTVDSPIKRIQAMAQSNIIVPGKQNMNWNIIGNVDTVNNITYDEIKEYIATRFVQDKLVIESTGRMRCHKIARIFQKEISRLPKTNNVVPLFIQNMHYDREPSLQVDTNKFPSSSIMIKFPFTAITKSRYYTSAKSLFNLYIRTLVSEVFRDKYGLSYAQMTSFSLEFLESDKNNAFFNICLDCEDKNIEKVFEVIPEYIERVKKYEITKSRIKDILEKSKRKNDIAEKRLLTFRGIYDTYRVFGYFMNRWQRWKLNYKIEHIQTKELECIRDKYFHTDPYVLVSSTRKKEEFEESYNAMLEKLRKLQ